MLFYIQNTSFGGIYKLFSSWGPKKKKKKKVPTRSDFTGITTFVGIFGAHNVGNTKYFEYIQIRNTIFYRPTPTLHLNLPLTGIILHLRFSKTSFYMIYKLVSSWGPKNVSTRSKLTGITILVGTFGPHNVINTRYTQTERQRHTQTQTQTQTDFKLLSL